MTKDRHTETITRADVVVLDVKALVGAKPSVNASPDRTTIPTADKIVDASGAVWTLSDNFSAGGQAILKDGKPFANGGGTLIAYAGGKVFCRNSSGAWFVVMGNGWVPSTSPL